MFSLILINSFFLLCYDQNYSLGRSELLIVQKRKDEALDQDVGLKRLIQYTGYIKKN